MLWGERACGDLGTSVLRIWVLAGAPHLRTRWRSGRAGCRRVEPLGAGPGVGDRHGHSCLASGWRARAPAGARGRGGPAPDQRERSAELRRV